MKSYMQKHTMMLFFFAFLHHTNISTITKKSIFMKSIKKRLSALATMLLLVLQVNAQVCPLQEAIDFTATDCRGNEIHLFDILDNGQAVLIHFFINHGLCSILMPYMTNAYSIMGCNTGEVYFMEISHRETDIICRRWSDEHHVGYPTIGIDGGGDDITTLYDVQTSNVFILIMPDRSITIHGAQELYPFSTDDVVNALAQYGDLEPLPCNGPLTVVNDTVLVISDLNIIPGRLELINSTDEDVIVNSFNADPQFNLRCFHNNEDVTQGGVTIPSGSNIVFNVYASMSSKDTFEGTIHISTSAGNVETLLLLMETLKTPAIQETAFNLYPNPATEHVIIEGENLGMISIFNLFGQKMEDHISDGKELFISTAQYPNGIYFVKTNQGDTKRFTIAH